MNAPTPADSLPQRPRKGGRKPGPLAEKQRHVVSVRLTDAEHERLTQEAERYHLSQGEVLRSVWQKQSTARKLVAPPTPEQVRQRAHLANLAVDLSLLIKQSHQGQDTHEVATSLLRKMNSLLDQLSSEVS